MTTQPDLPLLRPIRSKAGRLALRNLGCDIAPENPLTRSATSGKNDRSLAAVTTRLRGSARASRERNPMTKLQQNDSKSKPERNLQLSAPILRALLACMSPDDPPDEWDDEDGGYQHQLLHAEPTDEGTFLWATQGHIMVRLLVAAELDSNEILYAHHDELAAALNDCRPVRMGAPNRKQPDLGEAFHLAADRPAAAGIPHIMGAVLKRLAESTAEILTRSRALSIKVTGEQSPILVRAESFDGFPAPFIDGVLAASWIFTPTEVR